MAWFSRDKTRPAQGDMTPMIDMAFQLIAFFMVVISVAEADQNERIRLPSSELAKPPEAAPVWPVTLQLSERGTVLFAGRELRPAGLKPLLDLERRLIETSRQGGAAEATVVIRAHRDAKSGRVQEIMSTCRQAGFQKFTLRAKQQHKDSAP